MNKSIYVILLLSLNVYGSIFEDIFQAEEIQSIADYMIDEINRDNIRAYLRKLTERPHLGGTPAEWETANWIADLWQEQGLDDVHLVPYDVLLSYADKDKPNYARMSTLSGDEVWKSQGRTKPLYTPEEYLDEILPDFNAYSKAGNVEGEVVYAYFGTKDNMDELTELGVNMTGKIVIARYGKIFRGNIAKFAEERGAIALLLYSDPAQYAQDGTEHVYPHSVWMPDSAAAAGSVYLQNGDPLTPFYPSIESAFRIPEDEIDVPGIPVMPLSYHDAEEILKKMAGSAAPIDWQGGLNLTYKLGPGFEDPDLVLNVEVNTHLKRTTTYNVIGVIRGSEEPDRYVLLGNHRDAWIFGSVDPSSGSAAMMELSRTLMQYANATGWRPKRSLVFCSWGSEEYGLIGSHEWTEHFSAKLKDQAVAYINIDMALEGNYTLRTKAAPLLYTISKEIAKMVPNPDPEEVLSNRSTVFDTWAFRRPDPDQLGEPKMDSIGSGSDYTGLQHNLGIPSVDFRYTHSKEMFAEPLYHTLYETFALVDELYDRGFHFHAAVAQMWGIMAVTLSDAKILPLSIDEYAKFILLAQENFQNQFDSLILSRNITLDHFMDAGNTFSETVSNFTSNISLVNLTNPLKLRQINDKLILVERSFLDMRGLPGRPQYNHVVNAPSAKDNYLGIPFTGLVDTLNGIEDLPEEEQNHRWRIFSEHLAACTHHVLMAANALTEKFW